MSNNQKIVDQIGKQRRLTSMSDSSGRFSMLAIDQRQSLRRMISEKTGEKPEEVSVSDLRLVKRVVTEHLASKASAVLTDPLFGYESTWDVIPGSTGVILSIEQTGYSVVNNSERLTRLLHDWNVRMALDAGADGIKLLIWHNKNVSGATLEHQTNIVRQIGSDCKKHAIPFVLEVVCYPLDNISSASPEFADEKAHAVINAAATFSDPIYQVDLLKLEFPGNLKYVKEYRDATFHGGSVVHDLSEIKDFCRQLDNAARVPWVILSAGVEPDEFIENITLCNDAGASGFLCGRAVWKDVIGHFPDSKAMSNYIRDVATVHFDRILEANRDAHPWFRHRNFTNQSDIRPISVI